MYIYIYIYIVSIFYILIWLSGTISILCYPYVILQDPSSPIKDGRDIPDLKRKRIFNGKLIYTRAILCSSIQLLERS